MLLTWTRNWSSPAQDIKTLYELCWGQWAVLLLPDPSLNLHIENMIYYEGSLFCFVLSSLVMWKPPKSLCLWPHSWYYWKALHEYGCTELVSWCLDILVQELLNIEPFFHWKFNKIKTTFFLGRLDRALATVGKPYVSRV